MRAVICARFGGYTFESVDQLSLDRVLEIYASAEWLADQEQRAVRSKGSPTR